LATLMRRKEVSVMTADHPNNSAPRPSAEQIRKRLTKKAFHYLGRYASTSSRLESILRKFAQRKLDRADPALLDQIIREVTERCIRSGYIDDEAFIRSQFRQGLRSGFSQRRILLKLAQRGISRDQAEAVMDEQTSRAADQRDIELAAALIYARKKSVGPYSRAEHHPEDSQRHLARLARNGFAFDIAKQVIALPSANAADELLDKIYPHQLD
jgi:regulatory protein